MANTLGLYDPLFYAQEALIQLEKVLGMAAVVHRGYEKSPQEPGSTIKIRRPGTFTAQAMPISTGADITPDTVTVTLDQWYGVVFALTDQELTYTGERIVNEHIRPAAYALADKIDVSLAALYKQVPWYMDTASTIADFTNARKTMFDLKVPNGNRYMMINGALENAYLQLATFHEADKSSDGGSTQREGFLGRKFGFDIWANQNVQSHTPGALTGSPLINGAVAVGATTILMDAATLTGTVKAGDTFVVAGSTQRYAVAADATAAGNAISITTTEPVREVLADNAAVTFRQSTKAESLAFHRNAFALAMAPLSEMGNGRGADIASVSDPITNLALRSRMWYEGKEAKMYIGIDALWGVKTLDGQLAVRMNS